MRNQIVKCDHCTLVYVTPRLTEMELSAHYESNYHKNKSTLDQLSRNKWQKAIDRLKRFKTSGNLLEVGCSTGNFLNIAKSTYNVKGVEIARWAVDHAKEQELDVDCGTLENSTISSSSFDVIASTEVIEHLHQPRCFFAECARILKPDGILFLTSGNIESVFAKIRKNRWWYLAPEIHLSYFSPKTLDFILKDNGFEVIEFSGNKGLSFMDIIELKKFYPTTKEWLKDLFARLHIGTVFMGSSISVYARKL